MAFDNLWVVGESSAMQVRTLGVRALRKQLEEAVRTLGRTARRKPDSAVMLERVMSRFPKTMARLAE